MFPLVETSQLICRVDQLNGPYMRGILAINPFHVTDLFLYPSDVFRGIVSDQWREMDS